MVTIAICEDEPRFAEELREKTDRYLTERGLEGRVRIFEDGERLLNFRQNMDVVLMDIRLPGRNGMKVAEELRAGGSLCEIIFITSFREYVFQAFDMDAVHYLIKPVSNEKFCSAMDRAVKRAVRGREKTLLVTEGDRTVRLFLREIIYCEVFDHRLFVHTMSRQYQMSGTLDSLEEKLDDRFFRCHRSYLVNMEFVVDKAGGEAVVEGGGRVLISRRKQQEFTKRLLQVCRGGDS